MEPAAQLGSLLGNSGGNSGERMLNTEFFWHRIFTESDMLSLQEYRPLYLKCD